MFMVDAIIAHHFNRFCREFKTLLREELKKQFPEDQVEVFINWYTNHDNFGIDGSLAPILDPIVKKAYILFMNSDYAEQVYGKKSKKNYKLIKHKGIFNVKIFTNPNFIRY